MTEKASNFYFQDKANQKGSDAEIIYYGPIGDYYKASVLSKLHGHVLLNDGTLDKYTPAIEEYTPDEMSKITLDPAEYLGVAKVTLRHPMLITGLFDDKPIEKPSDAAPYSLVACDDNTCPFRK